MLSPRMPNHPLPQKTYRFPGFISPFYTQVPDVVFDELLPILSGAELKVLMYIMRRTFGFKKNRDNISLSQMVNGIKTKDGQVLDSGTGLGKSSVTRSLTGLEKKNIITRKRRSNDKKGYEATTYGLNIIDARQENGTNTSGEETNRPLSQNETRGGLSQNETRLVPKWDIQETVKQETEQQHVVVDLLIEKGISKVVAKKLTKQFDRAYIEEKIAFLDFLAKTNPAKIKNPKGWLRSAIEQDFAIPDGYKSPDQLAIERKLSEKAKETLAAQKRRIEARTQAGELNEVQRAKLVAQKLRDLEKEHNTTDEIREQWKSLKEQIWLADPKSLRLQTILQTCNLLKIENGVATFVCFNKMAGEWLKTKFDRLIKQKLKVVGTQEIKELTAVFVPLDGG